MFNALFSIQDYYLSGRWNSSSDSRGSLDTEVVCESVLLWPLLLSTFVSVMLQ